MATSARLEELQQKFNENPRRYFAPLANEHRKLGELDQAISLCRTHLPQQPQHVSGHIVLAQALFEAGNTPDARQSFELALDLDPENLIALRFLGDIARTQGDHLTARQWYERVLDADPRNDEIARLIREIENGAAAAPPPVAEAEPLEVPSTVAEAAQEPNEPVAEAPAAPVAAAEPIEDLATAWEHEVSALDATPAAEPPVQESTAEPTPVSVHAVEPEVEAQPELEPVVVDDFAPPAEELVGAGEPEAEPNESWAEPDEEFVASVPTVESTALPSPPPFADIDYSMFEAVADEEEIVNAAPPAEPVAASFEEAPVSQPEETHAHTDDWFAVPHGREPEGGATESSFDLDAAFQSVLPNNAEPAHEELEPQGPVADLADQPHSREWEVVETDAAIAEEPAFSAPFAQEPEFSAPLAQEPEVSAPLAEEPVFSAPLAQEPEFSAPIAEEPEFSAPLAQEPEFSAPITEEPEFRAPIAEAFTAPVAQEPAFTAPLAGPDSVDDAFAELDRLTASLEADIANSAMLLPDEDYSAPSVEAPQHVDALIGRTPETGSPVIEQAPIAFVTETMAELYLQQGFREEALAVYRQLLTMNPGDAVLESRVRALEGDDEQVAASAPTAEPEAFDMPRLAPKARADAVGQSMRAFLGFFARRRAPMRRRVTNEVVAVEPQPESRLSALFGSAPDTDDGAAAVLAGAFAQPNADVEPLPGRPTRAASEELSLGSVFGGGATSTGRAATFDEFFSTGTAEQSAPSPLDEEGSDMEQFTAWLEGLKKK